MKLVVTEVQVELRNSEIVYYASPVTAEHIDNKTVKKICHVFYRIVCWLTIHT